MNLIAHQFRKDCRRLFLALLLWAASFLLLDSLQFLRSPDLATEVSGLFTVATLTLVVVSSLLTLVLAVGVVLDDPPKGTTAFWLTRPLPRKNILIAKFCFFALIVFAPALVELAIMASVGASPHILAQAAWEKMLDRTVPVLGLAAFAITAESFGQFVITTLLVLIGGGLAVALWMNIPFLKGHAHGGGELLYSHVLVVQIAVLLFGGGIVVWRYLRRHARFAIGVVAAACVATMLLPFYVPLPESEHPAITTVEINLGRISPHPAMAAMVRAFSNPDGEIVVPEGGTRDAALVWADSERTPIFGSLMPLPPATLEPAALARVLAPVTILNLPDQGAMVLNLTPGHAAWQRLILEPARLVGSIQVTLQRFGISGEIPLQVGAKISGEREWKITACSIGGSDAIVSVRNGYYPPKSRDRIVTGNMTRFLDSGDPIFLLVNRSRNEAVLVARKIDTTRSRNFGGFITVDQDLEFSSPALDAAWMKEATLVCVRMVIKGQATANLTGTIGY